MNKAGGQGMGEAMVKVRENISKVTLRSIQQMPPHTPLKGLFTPLLGMQFPVVLKCKRSKDTKGKKKSEYPLLLPRTKCLKVRSPHAALSPNQNIGKLFKCFLSRNKYVHSNELKCYQGSRGCRDVFRGENLAIF